MTHLDNTRKSLKKEVVKLLRNEVSGWATVSGNGFSDVESVWPSNPPTDVKDEFPRGSVDAVSGEDTELSTDTEVKLRETVLKITAFSESDGEAEDLVEDCEDAVSNNWDSYGTDWHFRQTDGFTPVVEEGETEGKLRYNRSVNLVFETVKQNE